MTPYRAALASSDAKPATERPVRLMHRIYRDVGLAAVARELELSGPDLETEVGDAVKRGVRYVYLAPKADRESGSNGPLQPLMRQSAYVMSPARGSSDASAAAAPASLLGPAPVKQSARDVPKADCESRRNDIFSPSQALPRQPASAISPARGSSDASAAAAPASLLGPAPIKQGTRDVRKADCESRRNDISSPSQALPRQPASAISTARGSSDASAAAVLLHFFGLRQSKRAPAM